MFSSPKNKPQNNTPILCLYDENMQEIFRDKLHAFPLPEAVVLAYSEELFGDPEPCEIHRRAVQVRIYGEIAELLPQDVIIRTAELPDRICLYCREYQPAFVRLESGS
jgi:hypothetical protein